MGKWDPQLLAWKWAVAGIQFPNALALLVCCCQHTEKRARIPVCFHGTDLGISLHDP